jgi:hypothetical protein
MRLEVTHSTDLDKWIATNHYLKSAPAGARLRLWVIDESGRKIGAMMWGRPTSRRYCQESLLELTRMYFVDDTKPFVESRALAMARKQIRKHFPQIKGLIAYSSTGQGHEGTIYAADNWFNIGKTEKKAWNRKNRKNIDTSQKLRWVRSP